MTRREMLRRTGLGVGSLALTWLLAEQGKLFADDGQPVMPLRANGRASHVILLHMGGGPSQVDSFDPKPLLAKYRGQDVPDSIAKRVPLGNSRLRLKNLYPCPYEFHQYGQSGIAVSDLFRETAKVVDDLCIIRGCYKFR